MIHIDTDGIEARFCAIRERMEAARARSHAAAPKVELLAVSKNQPIDKMRALEQIAAKEGIRVCFGESYAQELREKRPHFASGGFHFIGRLQKNKIRHVLECAELTESLDSAGLATAIDNEARKQGKTADVFLQVNISGDPAKAGFRLEEVRPFIISTLPSLTSLRVRGLMTIVFLYNEPEAARKDYRALRMLRDECLQDEQLKNLLGTTTLALSMGMSDDFEVAIEEGATEVRIGTLLFGSR